MPPSSTRDFVGEITSVFTLYVAIPAVRMSIWVPVVRKFISISSLLRLKRAKFIASRMLLRSESLSSHGS